MRAILKIELRGDVRGNDNTKKCTSTGFGRKRFFRFRPIWKVFFDGNMMRRLATNVCGLPLTSTCILKIQARKRKTSPQ